LDLFAELADMPLDRVTPEIALGKVVRVSQQAITGATEVSITMLDQGQPSTVASTGTLAYDLDQVQYGDGHGPCLDAATGGETLKIDDMRDEPRWPHFAAAAAGRGARSSLSVPLPEQGAVAGALNVYATERAAFDDSSCELAAAFASYAAVALFNLRAYSTAKSEAEAIRNAMASRAVIEQAKGHLMTVRECTAAEAFDILIGVSQRTNVKLRDVAAALVDSLARKTE
jgi:GAF domain-containing protein